MNNIIKNITDSSFEEEVIKSEKTILIDFWAEWCGPCKVISPILDEIAQNYSGKLQIFKMNVDENQDVPLKFGIRGIPTIMIFKKGIVSGQKVGLLSKSQLIEFIDINL